MSVTVPLDLPLAAELPDACLVEGLAAREEDAYLVLVRRHTPLMLRVAAAYVRDRAAAEDVVQDTWIAVLRHVGRFEGRSSFKTWLMRILVNIARTRGRRERRTVPWSTVAADAEWWDEFVTDGADGEPECRLLAAEVAGVIGQALRSLPERQQIVVTLRDVEGWEAGEVCEALGISPGNQRVLLHRGRVRLRGLLAGRLG